MKIAFQMDPIGPVNIDADSTFVLALEAKERGHALFHYLPGQLSFTGGRVLAQAQPLRVKRKKDGHYELGPSETIDLGQLDVVLMRQDPPFDMGYITTTHLLEHIHPKTLVVNDPVAVRNAPEKLFVLNLAHPETVLKSMDHCKKSIRLCAELGRNNYSLHAGLAINPRPNDLGKSQTHLKPLAIKESRKVLIDACIEVAEYAQSRRRAT